MRQTVRYELQPPHNSPPSLLPRDCVILEMKYDERAPMWMRDMVRFFNLQRRPVCKYNACIDACRPGLQGGVAPRMGTPLIVAHWTS